MRVAGVNRSSVSVETSNYTITKLATGIVHHESSLLNIRQNVTGSESAKNIFQAIEWPA